MNRLPAQVKIVEVGPRDGLQNEPETIPTATKVAFIGALAQAGLAHIEATSFVSPKAVPQLADAMEVAKALPSRAGVTFSALAPNRQGLDRAIEAGMGRVAFFTAASDAFTGRNINMTVEESLLRFAPLARDALAAGVSVRGYVSTSFVCPYSGEVAKERVRDVTERLLAMGCDEVAISDTIGKAAPSDIDRTVGFVLQRVPVANVALHLHDTYGTALANVLAGLKLGVSTFDSSAGGLGGCPYAPGAAGNLATEDLIYFMNRMGIVTGVDLHGVGRASNIIVACLHRRLPSKVWQAIQKELEDCTGESSTCD